MKNQNGNDVFSRRFARHEDELKWLYMELYHNDAAAWEQFCSMLLRLWQERPESLRKMDLKRENHPDWYRNRSLAGMQLDVGAFAGNLQGVRNRLDYLQDCGAGFLHLMPLLESPGEKSDGGYAVSDFRKVQPELGTMEDLAALADDCRARGISVCLDFVMNHTSEDHDWARRARAGETEYRNRYFFYDSWDIPNWYEQTVSPVCPSEAPGSFTWCAEAGKVVMTLFHPYQWDLNYSNPAVFCDMTEAMLNLCNHGADMIRLDTLPYLWKAPGTSCRNLPQVHTLVRMLRMACEIVCPGTLLLGEIGAEPKEALPYFGTVEKPECHLLCNDATMAALWNTVATRNVKLLEHQLGLMFALPKENLFLNCLRSHEEIAWNLDYDWLKWHFCWEEAPHKQYLNDWFSGAYPGSPARGELYNDDPRLADARICGTAASLCGIEAAGKTGSRREMEDAVRLDGMLHALVFTLSGIPVLYSGDEIAKENDYSYHLDPRKAEDSRYLHRGSMDWAKAEKRSDPATPEGAVFAGISRLEKRRAKYGVFDSGADVWIQDTGNDQVLGIGRYYQGEKLLGLFNFSKDPQAACVFDESLYTDLETGRRTRAGMLEVPAGGYRWLHTRMK